MYLHLTQIPNLCSIQICFIVRTVGAKSIGLLLALPPWWFVTARQSQSAAAAVHLWGFRSEECQLFNMETTVEKLEAMVSNAPPMVVLSGTITNTCCLNTSNSSPWTVSGLCVSLETNTCAKPNQHGLRSDPPRKGRERVSCPLDAFMSFRGPKRDGVRCPLGVGP